MTPGRYSLQLYRGDTAQWQFVLWSDTEKTIPTDLDGVTPAAQIRDAPGGSCTLTLDLEIELPNIINASLPAVATSLAPSRGMWDLQLTWPDGNVLTVLAGDVLVTADVTVGA